MEGVNTTCVEIQVIRIGARRIVVWVLGRVDSQPARHLQDVGNSDLSARIARTLPLRHGCVESSGRWLLSLTGVKFTEVLPTGSVTHPWSPRYLAVRVTPFGSVMCTALLMRSITGFPTFARSA